jgi:acetylornithine deacetylase/succinyl-diaminopimelate desuccinylase family protein
VTVQQGLVTFVRSQREELLRLLSDLVAFRTGQDTSDFESELLRCQHYVREQIGALGGEVELFLSKDGYPVTVGRVAGSGSGGSIALNGHIDVKPPGDRRTWESDPWRADRRAGRIYGRGTADMKGGVAAALFALRALSASGAELDADVVFHVVGDEEVGGFSTREILDSFPLPDAVIVPEPTGLQLTPVEGGMMFLRIEVSGLETHAGNRYTVLQPGHEPKGASAIEKALLVVAGLQELEREWGERDPHPLLPRGFSTLHPGTIVGGPGGGADGRLTTPWQPPATFSDYCSIEYCIWFTPNESYEQLRGEVEDCVAAVSEGDHWLAHHRPRLTWEIRDGYVPAVQTSVDDPVVEALAKGLSEIGRLPVFGGFTATADLAWYADRDVPGILFGPGDITEAHSPNEFVQVDQLVDGAAVLAVALYEWGRPAGP